MTVSQVEYQDMVEAISSDMVQRLMERKGMTLREAFDALYTSNTYRVLNIPESAYFYQSPGYVYEQLMTEIDNQSFYKPLKQ